MVIGVLILGTLVALDSFGNYRIFYRQKVK